MVFRVSFLLRLRVHSPRGVAFQIGPSEAVARIKNRYSNRWLGASDEFFDIKTPSMEFLPFYFCQGTIAATFRGIVSYSDVSTDTKGNQRSSTRQVTTEPQPLNTKFGPNRTQIYAGYKYNIRHVHTALRREDNPLHMRKMSMIDTSQATINLFEESTTTLRLFVNEEVKRQAEETARAMIRSYHTGASTINVEFLKLEIKLEDVIPVFMPCYVVKTHYDAQVYTIYVNGASGDVGGPFILNALLIGRLAAISCVGLALLLSPNKAAGVFFGSILSVPIYYIAFYASKLFPSYRRDYYRTQRQRLRSQYANEDRSGFRPEVGSKRVDDEYRRSTYWDTHEFQTRKQRATAVKDAKGYYSILGLGGTESVNEIRSAFRKLVLTEHPDAGGSTKRMAKINEAYRVLRDPKRRAKYDLES